MSNRDNYFIQLFNDLKLLWGGSTPTLKEENQILELARTIAQEEEDNPMEETIYYDFTYSPIHHTVFIHFNSKSTKFTSLPIRPEDFKKFVEQAQRTLSLITPPAPVEEVKEAEGAEEAEEEKWEYPVPEEGERK